MKNSLRKTKENRTDRFSIFGHCLGVKGLIVFLALPFFVLSGFTGCRSSSLTQTEGGLAMGDAARLSLAVAQIKAQFPELYPKGFELMPWPGPKTPPAPGKQVLTGKGESLEPGLQMAQKSQLKLTLYLSKPDYNQGNAKLNFDDRGEETWPVVAYTHRGEPDDTFEYIYSLRATDGQLRYLVVAGGPFKAGGEEFYAYEGTLLYPGLDFSSETWQKAYHLNFGSRFPNHPKYSDQVKQAQRQIRVLDRVMAFLLDDTEALKKTNLRLSSARQRALGMSNIQRHKKALNALREEGESLENAIKTRKAKAQEHLLKFYSIRREISEGYASFVKSNHFSWQPINVQTRFKGDWKKAWALDARSERHFGDLSQLLESDTPIRHGRLEAKNTINANRPRTGLPSNFPPPPR